LESVENVLTVAGVGAARSFETLQATVHAHNFNCQLFTYPLSHPTLEDLQGFDLIQPGVGKGVALKALANHFELDISQTIAIGDSPNDLDMISVAGLGVAMGNAAPMLKAAAHVQVGTNAEDGVAEAIERYILA
jgi:hydroxymethylpyrimidine pyrophosphatase-like HAD family hydrolase